jgi:hypothetical protein
MANPQSFDVQSIVSATGVCSSFVLKESSATTSGAPFSNNRMRQARTPFAPPFIEGLISGETDGLVGNGSEGRNISEG